MTITTTINQVEHVASAASPTYVIPYYFLLETDLLVELINTETDSKTALQLTTDYTVSGEGNLAGGSITFVNPSILAPATGGTAKTLRITRVVPITQLLDYVQDDAFPAESHEKGLDKLTMICQQINARINTLVLAGITDATLARNIGAGHGVFAQKTGEYLEFRSILGDPAAGDVTSDDNEIFIDTRAILGLSNAWTGGAQLLEYTTGATPSSTDHTGWSALIHNQNSNTDNHVALRGHVYHDGTFNNSTGGLWGITTEAWSNPTNYTTLIGGELSVIQQCPSPNAPAVGCNLTFKNRADVATNPTAPVINGSLYNRNAIGLFISSQARPSGAGAAWGGVGSGWQTAIQVGDPSFGAGLDWEGGDFYPGSGEQGEYKAYSTVLDLTNCLNDLAGAPPWFALYKNSATYWGMRFNGDLTGALHNSNYVIASGGVNYAGGDRGTINLPGGTGAVYQVVTQSGGVVSRIAIVTGGSGYTAGAATTTATTGTGSGLTLTLSVASGQLYGGWLGIAAGGSGYVVNDLVQINGGTAGSTLPAFKVTAVTAGAITAIELQTEEHSFLYSLGKGFTVGTKTTTALTGVGSGATISVSYVHNDLVIGGEKWEWWRMTNPGAPASSGARHGYIDASFPGTPLTIDTSGATYTFPLDTAL